MNQIIAKLVAQSLRQTPKSAACSKRKKRKSNMAAVAIFCVLRDSALVNPVDRFLDELYAKTRVLAQGGDLWRFRIQEHK